MPNVKMDSLLDMIRLVRVGGVIEDAIFDFGKIQCVVNAIDEENNVLVRIVEPVGIKGWGKLGISNLKYFTDLYEITRGRDVDLSIDGNQMVMVDTKLQEVTGNLVEIRYQLTDLEAIRCKVEKETMMDEISKQTIGTYPLNKNVYDYCLNRLKVTLSASVALEVNKNGEIYLNIGQEAALESVLHLPMGKTKPVKKEMLLPVAKHKLIGILEVLEFPSDEPAPEGEKPKLKKKEFAAPTIGLVLDPDQNLIVLSQGPNIWVISEVPK